MSDLRWPRLQFGSGSRTLLWQSTLAIASALLLLLSFPPFSFSYLAWVAFVPLIYVAAGRISFRRALALGWLAGVVFTFLAENWIAHSMTRYGGFLTVVAYSVAFLFACVLGLFSALFAGVLNHLSRTFGALGIAAAPAVWVATEWLRPMVTGVTWNAAGISQVTHYTIARLGQLGGAYLVSWELVAVSTFLVLLTRSGDRNTRRVAAAVVIMILAPVFLVMRNDDQRTGSSQDGRRPGLPVRVLGVQPNLELGQASTDNFERNFGKMLSLTRDAIARDANSKPDLVIWAEAPLSLFYENDEGVRARVDALANDIGVDLIVNTITREGDRYFNSVHVVPANRDGVGAARSFRRYDKIRLVPFGEYVPWRPLLGRFVPTIVGDFEPGRETVVNTLRIESERTGIGIANSGEQPQLQIERSSKFIRIGSFICYEAAYPNLVRQFVNGGATLLVNVSDDAWFGDSAGAEQHLAHALMRAIENDRDLVRVTNSGITALLTADGRVVDEVPRGAAAVQVWEAVARSSARTFYTRHGDVFAFGCVALVALASGLGLFRRWRGRRMMALTGASA